MSVLDWLFRRRERQGDRILRALASVPGRASTLAIAHRLRLEGPFLMPRLYGALRGLEDKGLVRSQPGVVLVPERGHRPRRYYELTDAGRARVAQIRPAVPEEP